MRQEITYIANDGKEFDTIKECMDYEMKTINVEKLIEATKIIYDICNTLENCEGCPIRKATENTCRFNLNKFGAPPYEAWNFDDMK